MTVLVRNRCKQEKRTGNPVHLGNPKGPEYAVSLAFWLSQGPLGLMGIEERGKIQMKGKKLSRVCKFRQETGEWFELDAVWAILE